MTETQFAGFWQLLRMLSAAELLPHVLVIGSWAEYLYAQSGLLPGYGASLRTLDVDFLIRNQRKPSKKANILQFAKEAGYLIAHDTLTQATKLFTQSGLEVEFLIAQQGSGENAVLSTNMGVNAQSLAHLGMLRDHAVTVDLFNMHISVPNPEAYVLHKCVINKKRGSKSEKDRQSIKTLLNYVNTDAMIRTYCDLSKREKAAALDTLENLGDEKGRIFAQMLRLPAK
jgi:hypothetical protein